MFQAPVKPKVDLIALLKLQFGNSSEVKEQFERMVLKKGVDAEKKETDQGEQN